MFPVIAGATFLLRERLSQNGAPTPGEVLGLCSCPPAR